MTPFQYEISISAADESIADKKMEALITLASRLNEKELGKLAYIVENDPVKTGLAKQYLKLS